jgi:tRNA threonylcarbamoyladenosine biosynthesis protein TsaE
MRIISKSLADTEEIAKDFVEKLSVGFYEKACVVGLYGDLGSGKTTFTKAVAKILGAKGNITSPTFVIEKIYPILHPFFTKLVHIDAYRLESAEELRKLSWDEVLTNPKNLVLIEWPENVASILPENHMKINFKFVSENEREIEI